MEIVWPRHGKEKERNQGNEKEAESCDNRGSIEKAITRWNSEREAQIWADYQKCLEEWKECKSYVNLRNYSFNITLDSSCRLKEKSNVFNFTTKTSSISLKSNLIKLKK